MTFKFKNWPESAKITPIKKWQQNSEKTQSIEIVRSNGGRTKWKHHLCGHFVSFMFKCLRLTSVGNITQNIELCPCWESWNILHLPPFIPTKLPEQRSAWSVHFPRVKSNFYCRFACRSTSWGTNLHARGLMHCAQCALNLLGDEPTTKRG